MGLQTFIKEPFQHFFARIEERRRQKQLQDQIRNDINAFIKKNSSSPSAIALLTAKLTEKTIFTTEKTGEMVRRDVPQKAISFDDCRIHAPAHKIGETHFKIKHLTLLALCRQTVQDTSDLQTWKKEIEAQENLMEFKIHS